MSGALQNLNFIISLTDRMSKPLGGVMKNLDSIQTRFAKGALTAGAGVGGLYAVRSTFDSLTEKAIGFESAMADVRKVTNFPTPAGLSQFGDELLKLSRTIPISAEGLAQIATAGGQMGIAEKDLSSFTQIVAKMSTAFDMLPDAAGESIAKLSNIFHIPVQGMALVGDAINTLDNNMAAKSRDIVDVLARIGGTSQLLGLTANQAGALSSAMLSLGQTPELAGTSINALLLRLGTARNQSKDFVGALGDIGLSVAQLEANLKSGGAQATINDFLARLSKLDKAAQLNTLGQLFGAEYSDNLGVLVGGLDQYRKALGLVNNESQFQNSMQKEFDIRAATTANRLKLLGNRFDELKIATGGVLVDILGKAFPDLFNGLDTINEKFATFTDKHPLLTKAIGYTVVGLGALVAALSIGAIAWGIFTIAMLPISAPLIAAVAVIGALTWWVFKARDALTEFLVSADPVGYLTAKWEGLKTWWYGLPVAISIAALGFMQQLGVFAAIDWVLAKWDALKAWWSGFTGWLAGLNPFGSLLSGIDSVINRAAGIGAAMRSALSGGNVSIPAVSVAPGGGGAPRNILGALQGKGGSNSTSNKNVTVNVHNNGGSVSPAAIGHHLKMAGG
jgi:TP901 family phage tail tape measure protein